MKEVFLGGTDGVSWYSIKSSHIYNVNQSIQGFIHDKKPAETDEKRRHVFTLSCPCHETGGIVVDLLMDQCSSRCSVNIFPDPVDVMEVEVSALANVIDMRLKVIHRVPDHSEVAHVGTRGYALSTYLKLYRR